MFSPKMYSSNQKPKLTAIGDLSCDIEGAIEATIKSMDPGNPAFVYDVKENTARDGFEGRGPLIMAVDNLPCELAKEASSDFSLALKRFVPEIAKANYGVSFENLNLPREVKDAVIVHRGALTPGFQYLGESLCNG